MIKVIRDIKVKYDDNTQESAEYLFKVLNNNYDFISDLLPKKVSLIEDDDFTYIKDIESYLHRVIKNIYHTKAVNDIRGNTDFLNNMYYNILLSFYDEKSFYEKELPEKGSDYYLSLSAFSYYDSDDDYVKFILNGNNEDKDVIFKWLRNKCRFNCCERLINSLSDSLEIDKNLLNIVIEYNDSFYADNYLNKSTDTNHSSLSINELESLFQEFLLEIDSTGTWLFQYQNLKNNKLLIFTNKDENDESISLDEDIINIRCSNNILDFLKLTFEFMKYLFEIPGVTIPSLRDFPAVYYEKIGLDFLISKGYNEDEINNIKIKYMNNLSRLYVSTKDLLEVLYSDDNTVYNILESNNNDYINTSIDNKTIKLIVMNDVITNVLSYVIGSSLAYQVLEMEDSNQIMYSMYEDLSLIDSEEVYKKITKDKHYNKI